MISNRQWMALCLTGFCWSSVAFSQEGGGAAAGSGSAGSGSGTSSGSGSTPSSGATSGGTPSGTKPSGTTPSGKTPSGKTKPAPGATDSVPLDPAVPDDVPIPNTPPKPGGSADPFALPPSPNQPAPGESSSFGTPREGATPKLEAGATEPKPADATGEASAFGPGTGATTTNTPPPSYTLPGFFGGPGTTFTGGQGRLARPRFRFRVTTSQGYDDNVLQSPDDPQRFPDQRVLVDPGTPDTVTFIPVTREELVFLGGGLIGTRTVPTGAFQPVVTPGRDPVFQTIRAPEPQQRFGSLVSRAGFAFDFQKFTRRSLFTMDLNGQVDHYWKRPGTDGKDDYSGTFALNYLYNITPRLTASLATNIAYISQPDISRINTPDRVGAGALVNALARLNVTYRLTPRLSGVLSVGQNAVIFTEKSRDLATGIANNGDSHQTTFSAEARYLWKPRYTLLAEFRHVLINYPDTPSVNASTDLLLLGVEAKLTSRLTATLRLGQSVRVFDEAGDSSTAPYGEGLLSYRIDPTSSVQWSSRFGFDEPLDSSSEIVTYRTTLTYFKSFTPKLTLSAGITGVFSTTTSSSLNEDLTQQTLDANIGLQYRFNRQLTLNATYSFTQIVQSTGDRDYDRSRFFLGAEYEF